MARVLKPVASNKIIHFTKNLQYLMKEYAVKSVAVAKAIGMSSELICKLRSGELSNPTVKVITGLSQYFNVSVVDLIYTDLEQVGLDPEVLKETYTFIPLMEWVDIEEWQETEPSFIVANKELNQKSTFTIQLTENYGIFSKDTNIIVDTAVNQVNNDYVLIQSKENGVFYIKQCIIEEEFYLKSIILELKDSLVKYDKDKHKIYGVIIGYQKSEFFRE